MENTSISSVMNVLTSGSKIPIFTGKPVDLEPWLAALKKKARIYKLTDPELVNLAYDFSDGTPSEWIGDFLEEHPNTSSTELFKQLSALYGEFANPVEAARALIRVRQIKDEALVELASRMTKLARIAYQDSELREGPAVQVQLAEFFLLMPLITPLLRKM